MLLPRAFAAMEILGCCLCGWRSLADTLTGLEDRRRSTRRRPASTASFVSSGSRTLLRDALASGDIWIEIDDVDDAAFEVALARVVDEGSAVDIPPTAIQKWPQSAADGRVDAILERLDHLEGRLNGAGKRGRPRRLQVDALAERLTALETRVQTLEADLLAHTPDRIELEDRVHAGAHAAEDLTATTDPDHRGDTDVDVVDVADLNVAAMHFASTGSTAIEILDPIQGAAPAPASKESVAAEEEVESIGTLTLRADELP